ncbi:MAG: hypothetical protein KGD57_01845 [Candidatus Lokiarchaeota archaeon]|nr:hypothetical protein [Candidatus Lokiarchaeota archaeon]
MDMILNTIRMNDYDQNNQFISADIESLEENLAIGFINPLDFKEMYLVPSLKLRLSNNYGDVVINFKQDENVSRGLIIMPVSIWSNQLTYTENNNIVYKNIKVKVEGTRDPPTKFIELVNKIKNYNSKSAK